jgi:hypothetical protein
MGTVPSVVSQEIAKQLPRTFIGDVQAGIDYPAVGPQDAFLTGGRSFAHSVALGADWLVNSAALPLVQRCPNVRIVLIGLSQGASVIDYALFAAQRPTPLTDRIAAILLFGDPFRIPGKSYNIGPPNDTGALALTPLKGYGSSALVISALEGLNGQVPAIPDQLASRTRSYCLPKDPVCGATNIEDLVVNSGVHTTYPQSAYIAEAVDFAVSSVLSGLGTDASISGACDVVATTFEARGGALSVVGGFPLPGRAWPDTELSQPLKVDPDGSLVYDLRLPSGSQPVTWSVSVAGVPVSSGSEVLGSQGSLADRVSIPSYLPTRITGKWPYTIHAEWQGDRGVQSCDGHGTALILGSPFGSPVWLAGMGTGLVGVIALLLLLFL